MEKLLSFWICFEDKKVTLHPREFVSNIHPKEFSLFTTIRVLAPQITMTNTTVSASRQPSQAAKQTHNVQVYLLALVASMGAVMFGYDLAFVGTTISLKSFKQ